MNALQFTEMVEKAKSDIKAGWESTPIMGDPGGYAYMAREEASLREALARATQYTFFEGLPKDLQEECREAARQLRKLAKANRRCERERHRQRTDDAKAWEKAIRASGKPKLLARQAVDSKDYEPLEVGAQFFISTHELRQAARKVILGHRA